MLNKRQEQILAALSEKNQWITGKSLSAMMKVSDRTIRSDIETINREIEASPIESNVRLGYRIAGAYQGKTAEPGPQTGTAIPQTPGARCVYIIQKLLFDAKELNIVDLQNQIYISDYSIQNDLKRIRKMIEPYGDLKLVKNRECISLQGSEISKRRFYRELLVAEVQENFLNLNRMAHLYKNFDLIQVKDIFVDVLEEYDYSIHEALFSMLILHAGTSIERMSACHYIQAEERQQGLEETIEYQISKTFFEMGVSIVGYMEEQLGVRVSDMEGGFIALHLGAASERMNSVRKYRAVMILPHNQSFSRMCEKKITDMFGSRMEIVKVLSYYEEETVRLLEPDLLLTTFPVAHKLDIPTVSISMFVDSETEARLLQALNSLDKKRFHLEFTSHIGHLIRPEHYYRNLDGKTPEEIICRLCDGMEKAGIIDRAFKDSVMEREKLSPTSFANALAIPHGFRSYAASSTIAVAQLKKPVKWGSFEVKLVMLFAINESDQRMIKIFF